MKQKAKTINEIAKFQNDKPVVYIAGKVTGLDYQLAYDKFMMAHITLENAGYQVINPMNLVHKDAEWKQAMRICLSFLPHADFIYLLDNWADSEGATWEYEVAKRLGIDELIECPECTRTVSKTQLITPINTQKMCDDCKRYLI